MHTGTNHITVCVCTLKRPALLARLLNRLDFQITKELFSYSIVIVDNDCRQSAREVASSFAARSALDVKYCVEPEKNIALARNRALTQSKGNFAALIDDDEIPERDWLLSLFCTCTSLNADGVLGPVQPYFEHDPPNWVKKGNFFNRPEHYTGYRLSWHETRSGNVLFKREIINGLSEPFRAKFGTGSEDVDFFRRMMEKGNIFIWCQEALVYELIPPHRCNRTYQIRKSLLRGGNSIKHEYSPRSLLLLKSVIAIALYAPALPFLYIVGDHIFMRYLDKLCDHLGRVLSLLDINPIKERDL